MTVTDRTMRYLTIITKVNMDSRPRLVRRDNSNIFFPISNFEDLSETLDLMERGGSSIRPYIAEWYNLVFLPTYKPENGELKSKTTGNGEKAITVDENYVAVTSTQLRDKTSEILRITISGDDLRHKFIDPLINQGIIDKERVKSGKLKTSIFQFDETGGTYFHRLVVKSAN